MSLLLQWHKLAFEDDKELNSLKQKGYGQEQEMQKNVRFNEQKQSSVQTMHVPSPFGAFLY